MSRDLTEPVDTRWPHWCLRVQALGDGVRDNGLTLFLEQLDQSILRLDQRIDLLHLALEEAGNRSLLLKWWNWNEQAANVGGCNRFVGASGRDCVELRTKDYECLKGIRRVKTFSGGDCTKPA